MSKILSAYAKRKDLFLQSILFASLAGSLSLLLHAFVDLNYQIPGNIAYFYVVFGMGIAAGSIKKKRNGHSLADPLLMLNIIIETLDKQRATS